MIMNPYEMDIVYEMRYRGKTYHKDPAQCLLDVDTALDILEEYKELELDEQRKRPVSDQKVMEIARKKAAIDKLEDWIIDKAFEAPIAKIIEDFIYTMNACGAKCAEGTEAYQLFSDMRDAAEDVIIRFL